MANRNALHQLITLEREDFEITKSPDSFSGLGLNSQINYFCLSAPMVFYPLIVADRIWIDSSVSMFTLLS